MKKNEISTKLPYSSPAIDVINGQEELLIICNSIDGNIGNGSQLYDLQHMEDNW